MSPIINKQDIFAFPRKKSEQKPSIDKWMQRHAATTGAAAGGGG